MTAVEISASMKHWIPRPMLSVDPHLQVDGAIVLRLARSTESTTVDLADGRHIIAVVPSKHPVGDIATRVEQSRFYRTETGVWIDVDSGVARVRIDYRPFPLQASITRGFLHVSIDRSAPS